MPDEALAVDLCVVGGGMAGMSAGAAAAMAGAQVGVVERAADVGGSAALSVGGYWTYSDVDTMLSLNPHADPSRARRLVEDFDAGLDFIRSVGADVGPVQPLDQAQGFPSRVAVIDVHDYFRRCKNIIEKADGWIVTNTEVQSLTFGSGQVQGLVAGDTDGRVDILAGHVLLATGGFQASEAARRELMGDYAVPLLLRTNPYSTGGGIRLARQIGAALSRHTNGFYGHLMAWPLDHELRQQDFFRLSQIYSPSAILLDRTGQRFTDDSLSYYGNAREVALHPDGTALLIGDLTAREVDAAMYPRGVERIDRVREAAAEGAHVAEADTLEALAAAARQWGFHNVDRGVTQYNAGLQDEQMRPPRARNRTAVDRAPFFAMEVKPAITFTFRGLVTDSDARVLDADGIPIPGLLAAGVNAGGLYFDGYGGGLSMSTIFGVAGGRFAAAGGGFK